VMMAVIDPYGTGAASWAHSYLYHLLFLQDVFYPQYYPLFWSLAVEFQFYLLAPVFILALLLLPRPGLRYLALAAAIIFLAELRALAVLHGPPAKTYDDWFFSIRIFLPYSLDGILGGMLCGFLWNDEKARAFMRKKHIGNGLFFAGVLLILALDGLPHPLEPVSLFDQTFLLLFVAGAFSCMMLGLLAGSAGNRLFSSRPLRHVAMVSYSMYLIHITYIKDVFDIASRLTRALDNPFATYFTGMALMTAVTVLLSTLMYRYIEKPFIDWAKRPRAQATSVQA
jgi:peptidoglycan/LPS O-acetylase OafA/YrhL